MLRDVTKVGHCEVVRLARISGGSIDERGEEVNNMTKKLFEADVEDLDDPRELERFRTESNFGYSPADST